MIDPKAAFGLEESAKALGVADRSASCGSVLIDVLVRRGQQSVVGAIVSRGGEGACLAESQLG